MGLTQHYGDIAFDENNRPNDLHVPEASQEDPKEKRELNCSRFQSISQQIKYRSFLIYTIASLIIYGVRMAYISQLSLELDEYGLDYQTKYREEDFHTISNLFFENFEFTLNQTIIAMNRINDIYFIADKRYSSFDFTAKKRCHILNVTQCASQNKEEEIVYKQRADSFYSMYYFMTTSIYVYDGSYTSDDTSTAQKNFNFMRNLHHKLLIVFPNDKVGRIFPVQYISTTPLLSQDFVYMKEIFSATTLPDWITNTMTNGFNFEIKTMDIVESNSSILRLSRTVSDSSGNTKAVVGFDIYHTQLDNIISSYLKTDYSVYFISNKGEIIHTNDSSQDSMGQSSIFNLLKGCHCTFVSSALRANNGQDSSCQESSSISQADCAYIGIEGLWRMSTSSPYQFFILTTSNSSSYTSESNRLFSTISYVYSILFILLFGITLYSMRASIDAYATEITNPIRQISYKIQRIMHNIFNPKQFSKIRTDEIVIRERTEIRKLANQFGETFQRLIDKNLFQNTLIGTSIDRIYQKSKEISDKPHKDTIVDEVRNIVQSYLDDHLLAQNNEYQIQDRNKYARSNNKSKHNLDISLNHD